MATLEEILKFTVQTGGESDVAALAKSMLEAGDAGKLAAPEVQKLVDEFTRLSATGDSITGLVSLKARLSETADQLVTARLKVEQLEAQFDAAEAPSARLVAQLGRARGAVADLQGQFNLQQAAITKASGALTQAGVDTEHLDAAQRAIQSSLVTTAAAAVKLGDGFGTAAKNTGPVSTAIGSIEKSIKNAGQSISDFANKTTNIGSAVTAVGSAFKSAGSFVGEFVKKAGEITGIAAVIGGLAATFTGFELFKKGAEEAGEFDEALAKLGATSGLTGDELDKLREQAEAAANATNTGAAETVRTLAELTAQLGSSGAALDALTPTLLLAKAAQISLADATTVVAASLKSFHDPALTAADVTDTLATVAQKTGANLGALTGAFGKLAPLATELGLSFKDTVAAIGLLQTRGVGAEAATRSLSVAFAALNDPTSELRGQIVGLGIDTSSLSTIIDGLSKAGPRGEEALRSLGARGSNALLALVQAGAGSLSQFEGQLNNVVGATQRVADAVENNLHDAAKDFSKVLGNVAGELEAGAFAPLTKEVQSLTDRLKALPQSAGFAQIKQAITDFTTGAIAGFEKLIGSIDFKAAGQNIAQFIADAGENIKGFVASLGTIGTVASGVASAFSVAFNGVKTVFFTVGAAASATIAVLLQGLAAVTQIAGGSLGVVAALRDEADQYIENAAEFGTRAAESARNAAAGIGKIADSVLASGSAAATATKQVDAHTAAEQRNAQQTALLRAQYDALPGSVKKLLPPLDQMIDGFKKTGDSAATAAPKIQQVFQVASIIGTRSGLTVSQLKDLQAAFDKLGVTSQDALSRTAEAAQKEFEQVRNSSDGSAAALANTQNAFLSYAQKALAATAQLSDSDKLKVRADLEAQASTIGVTNALKGLEEQSDSSAASLTSDAAQYDASLKKLGADALEASLAHQRAAHDQQSANAAAAESTKENAEADQAAEKACTEYGDAANAAALATRGITADTSHANDGMQRLTQAIGEARAGFLSISQAAATYYDTVLQGAFKQALANDDAGAGFDRVAKAIQVAADETNKAIANQRSQISASVTQINELGTAANKSFGSFGEDAGVAASKMAQLSALIESGKYQAGLLGQADLSQLDQALQAAAQRAQQLADAEANAKKQLIDLNNQLLDQIDDQTGNKADKENRRYQEQLQQLQDLYSQAGKLGTAEYNEAVANAKKLHELNMQQIQQEQDAKNGTDSSGGSGASSSAPTRGSAGGLVPVRVNINGRTYNIHLQNDQQADHFGDMLGEITRAKRNSILQ